MFFFKGKKAQTGAGAKVSIAIVLFEIILYLFVYFSNIDTLSSGSVGSNTGSSFNVDESVSSSSDLKISTAKSWIQGFNVSLVFELPSWFNIFYVTFLSLLLFLGIYMLARG